jgi:hypothetical protein
VAARVGNPAGKVFRVNRDARRQRLKVRRGLRIERNLNLPKFAIVLQGLVDAGQHHVQFGVGKREVRHLHAVLQQLAGYLAGLCGLSGGWRGLRCQRGGQDGQQFQPGPAAKQILNVHVILL